MPRIWADIWSAELYSATFIYEKFRDRPRIEPPSEWSCNRPTHLTLRLYGAEMERKYP